MAQRECESCSVQQRRGFSVKDVSEFWRVWLEEMVEKMVEISEVR